jgi:hypothetical protein
LGFETKRKTFRVTAEGFSFPYPAIPPNALVYRWKIDKIGLLRSQIIHTEVAACVSSL